MRFAALGAREQNHFVALTGPRHGQSELEYSATKTLATVRWCGDDMFNYSERATTICKIWDDAEHAA